MIQWWTDNIVEDTITISGNLDTNSNNILIDDAHILLMKTVTNRLFLAQLQVPEVKLQMPKW